MLGVAGLVVSLLGCIVTSSCVTTALLVDAEPSRVALREAAGLLGLGSAVSYAAAPRALAVDVSPLAVTALLLAALIACRMHRADTGGLNP